jgi:Tfp pilus assembly protein PilF
LQYGACGVSFQVFRLRHRKIRQGGRRLPDFIDLTDQTQRKVISRFLTGTAVLAVAACVVAQRGTAGYIPQLNLGDRALAAQRYTAAAAYYRTALQWNPNGVGAHVGLGNVYLKTSHLERAREEFAAALKVSPHSADAERGIHEARTDGEEQEAFQELELLVPREPKNADIHTTYAEELLERDRAVEAKAQADLALKLDPHQWHAFGVLGQVAKKDGDLTKARLNLEMAIKHDDTDDDSLFALGEIEVQQKNYGPALKLFRQLVKVAPEESAGHLKLAEVLSHLGDARGASQERAVGESIEAAAKLRGGQ